MIMQSLLRRSGSKGGFTLVELAIVLGVSSLLFTGLWRLMSSGNQQTRDQAAADQMRQLVQAVKNYLTTDDEGKTFVNALSTAGTTTLDLACGSANTLGLSNAHLCNYLPGNSSWAGVKNSYGQTYSVKILRNDSNGAGNTATSYSFLILTNNNSGSETISDTSGGRIAGLIGTEGGFIYNAEVCNAANTVWACGAYGGWSVNITLNPGYNFSTPGRGHVAARWSYAQNTDTSTWLARDLYEPASTYNTMHTNLFFYNSSNPTPTSPIGTYDLYLGGNTIYGGTTDSQGTSMTTGGYGKIENLKHLLLYQKTTHTAAANSNVTYGSALEVYGCQRRYVGVSTDFGECDDPAVSFQADVAVAGTLKSMNFEGTAFVYNTSDMNLKNNIMPIRNALDDLSKIKAVSFTMDGSDTKRMGVLAQEVEKVYPSLVQPISGGYKGVDYMGLIGPVIGAIHELKEENDSLREQIRVQNKTIKELHEKVSKGM